MEEGLNLWGVLEVAEGTDAVDAAAENAEFAMELNESKVLEPSRRLDPMAL